MRILKENAKGKLSVTFSVIAISTILFLLPAGMRHIDEPIATIFRYLFFAGIVSGILGVVFGVSGKRDPNNSLARRGLLLGMFYFAILIVGVASVWLLLSNVH